MRKKNTLKILSKYFFTAQNIHFPNLEQAPWLKKRWETLHLSECKIEKGVG